MSHEPMSSGLSEDEYKQVIAQLEADHPPVSPEDRGRQWDDIIWVRDNPALQQRYPRKWVAVRNRQVLAVGNDWEAVVAEAEKVSNLRRSQIVIIMIPDVEAAFWDLHAFDTSFPN
jgi:hypothetical protein